MKVTTQDVSNLLDQLLRHIISREDAEKWAVARRDALDLNDLEFCPKDHEDRIWDAIQFVELFAEKIDKETYLYSDEDLVEYVDSMDWNTLNSSAK